jgi:hypothetical protein
MGYGIDCRGSNPGKGKIFLSSAASRPSLGPTSASYPMGTGADFPRGKAEMGMKLTIHIHLVPRSRMVELYLHSPIRLDGIVLN